MDRYKLGKHVIENEELYTGMSNAVIAATIRESTTPLPSSYILTRTDLLAVFGLDRGASIMATLRSGTSATQEVAMILEGGGLDLAHPEARDGLTSFKEAGILTSEEETTLLSLSTRQRSDAEDYGFTSANLTGTEIGASKLAYYRSRNGVNELGETLDDQGNALDMNGVPWGPDNPKPPEIAEREAEYLAAKDTP